MWLCTILDKIAKVPTKNNIIHSGNYCFVWPLFWALSFRWRLNFFWKSPDSFVSDNVDVVLKKSREKILFFDKVRAFYITPISKPKIWLSKKNILIYIYVYAYTRIHLQSVYAVFRGKRVYTRFGVYAVWVDFSEVYNRFSERNYPILCLQKCRKWEGIENDDEK